MVSKLLISIGLAYDRLHLYFVTARTIINHQLISRPYERNNKGASGSQSGTSLEQRMKLGWYGIGTWYLIPCVRIYLRMDFFLLFLYIKVRYESYPPPSLGFWTPYLTGLRYVFTNLKFCKQTIGISFSHSKPIPHTSFFWTKHPLKRVYSYNLINKWSYFYKQKGALISLLLWKNVVTCMNKCGYLNG